MSVKVIGAGFGRTGTLSLKFALEKLGFDKCYHMMECNPEDQKRWLGLARGETMDWEAVFDGFQASVDWPSSNFWREQRAHYPDAKVILSLRDGESWYASVMNTIYPHSSKMVDDEIEANQNFGRFAMEMVWDRLFDGKLDDKARVIDAFNKHNQAVIDEVPADQLLVLKVGSGWKPLCDFLEIDIPDTDYPRVNSTEEFNQPRG